MTADKDTPDQADERGTTAKPFLIALIIAVIAIGGILSWNIVRPSEQRVPDSGQIAQTVGQYYGALNHGRYADLVANTCAKDRAAADFPQEAGFADARKAAVEREGDAVLDENGIKNVQVNGDNATADLVIKYSKIPEKTEQAKFVREDDKWKKCS
ncbi:MULTISPECIES: Rv0361 family membrane protein [Tsukamurella]|uniref:DUF4878 domain-containing protein n=1 Tax=Tsukamurella strandjordii TaxID=147577 RepID=A0AA90NEB4_9ACTN|nr:MULTISPECIES: hypothetical protein [Tsukamurella]MDP0396896.1 hypothetical protein [Tsukamurella strandjordii]GIZ96698.1 hypothetical protein TTY48_13100 [Tsukamurella sp. TY48]